MELKKWTTTYSKWFTEKGKQINVFPIRYLGVQSKRNHIYKKTNSEGITYCAEIYECLLENGSIKKVAFKVLYDEYKYNNSKNNYFKTTLEVNESNYLTDVIDFNTMKKLNVPNKLLQLETQKLRNNIKKLNDIFKSTEDDVIKIGVQIYLERLQTPCLQTMKKWKYLNPYLKRKIIEMI